MTTTRKLLGRYKNGNYSVLLYDDGTKVRWNDEDYMTADFPESMDIKICNRCALGCAQCHEQSTPDGCIGDLNNPLLDTLHPYTELAIGGGNPLEHPELIPFLQRMKDKHVICNLTVNLEHFLENEYELLSWSKTKLIHGLGISVSRPITDSEAERIRSFPNSVVHVIAGIVTESVMVSLAGYNIRLLILGYKQVGRGVQYYKEHAEQINNKISVLAQSINYWKNYFKLISFDNLAIEQLHVKDLVDSKTWDEGFMGDDGQFTMYMDLCKNEYAVASTMERYPIPEDIKTIDELFAIVKQEAREENQK